MFRYKLFFTPISNPSPTSSSKKLKFSANLKVPTKVMITKMAFWQIFNTLLFERHNAFYNPKESKKHILLCATISNKFFSKKTTFYSTYIKSMFNQLKTTQNLSRKPGPKKTNVMLFKMQFWQIFKDVAWNWHLVLFDAKEP